MSHVTTLASDRPSTGRRSTVDELAALGWELNANQYRVVHLAARYDVELEWFRQGFKSSSSAIADRLQLGAGTAREWVRVGLMLRDLPLIDAAFGANEISYAKARILTRWADPDNEAQLLALAEIRTANRLSTAIAKALAEEDDDDEARDIRHHDARSYTTYTDGDGMVVIRIVLPPSTAKPIVAAVDGLVTRIARTPFDDQPSGNRHVTTVCTHDREIADDWGQSTTCGHRNLSADRFGRRSVNVQPDSTTQCGDHRQTDAADSGMPLAVTLAELRRRWQPGSEDDWMMPTLAQQRADAFAAFFLRLDVELTTEVVIHVRGDGNTFDDGTPITNNAVARQLDESLVRLLIHDAEGRPVNASSRRRHPTKRQQRVVLETHNHECVDCAATDLLQFDHVPPYDQTRHTITDELEPRCAPCHRARHRTTTRP